MSVNSIYIPRMSIVCDEQYIKFVFKTYCIGTVSHVDFTPINQKPGFRENKVEEYKSAFVHFSEIRTTELYPMFWSSIANEQPYKLYLNPYGMAHPKNPHWICLKNKNPVQRTMMNIHQVVENGRYLEGLIEAQEKIIQEQAEKLKELEKNMDNMRSVVYQLVSGLFNKETQRGIQKLHDDILFGSDKLNHDFKDENKWGIYPTTLQGDACEKKIAELEERLQILENDLEDHDIWKR